MKRRDFVQTVGLASASGVLLSCERLAEESLILRYGKSFNDSAFYREQVGSAKTWVPAPRYQCSSRAG